METGYIKLYRQFIKWEWYTDIPTRILFEHCLLRANHKAERWRGLTIEAGQFITSLNHLAQETGLTIRQVRTAIKKLKTTQELTQSGYAKYSIVTIKNWAKYQSSDTVSDKQMTNKRQTNDKQMTTNKNEKNEKNEKNIIINVDDDVFQKNQKNVTLDQVPDIVKENKNIKNPCAYWANLPEDAKERIKNQKRVKSRGEYLLENTEKVLAQQEFAKKNATAPTVSFVELGARLRRGKNGE